MNPKEFADENGLAMTFIESKLDNRHSLHYTVMIEKGERIMEFDFSPAPTHMRDMALTVEDNLLEYAWEAFFCYLANGVDSLNWRERELETWLEAHPGELPRWASDWRGTDDEYAQYRRYARRFRKLLADPVAWCHVVNGWVDLRED